MDPKAYQDSMVKTMQSRTGKTLEEWVELLRGSLPADLKGRARLKWLKDTYGLGQNSAMLILDRMETGNQNIYDGGNDLVASLFAEKNAVLKPLYDWLESQLKQLGDDVQINPRKTYVPFYRNKVFVFVKPYKGKLHLGLGVPETTEHPMLESAKGLGGPERIKHKIVIGEQADLNDAAMALIRQAYELN